ncbi:MULTISPECIES: hypothetical protein [Nitrosomonas]|nr:MULTISPECIES: hypothetical protein [Nitrosomonas]UVS61907.1 hypothetical protein NX761_01865 [Nitrosomonas sp. PLL12]
MVRADHGIAFPITYTLALVNNLESIIDADSAENCATPFLPLV